MAGRMQVTGTEELAAMLNRMGADADKIASAALYDGADVVADAYTVATKSIQARKRGNGESRTEARYPTPEEKAAIMIGVSRFRRDGDEVNTRVGAAEGYMTVDGKNKAIKLIANAINSGTSFMHKQPVYRRALNRVRKTAEDTMVKTAEDMINEITRQGGK